MSGDAAAEGYVFDEQAFELLHDGVPIALEPQVLEVLRYFLEHPSRLVRKEELLDSVWGDRFVSESALTSRIRSLRRALGDDGKTQRLVDVVNVLAHRDVAIKTITMTGFNEEG